MADDIKIWLEDSYNIGYTLTTNSGWHSNTKKFRLFDSAIDDVFLIRVPEYKKLKTSSNYIKFYYKDAAFGSDATYNNDAITSEYLDSRAYGASSESDGGVKSGVVSVQSSSSTTDTISSDYTIDFHLFSGSSSPKLTLNATNQNLPKSMSITPYFPQSNTYQLMNGGTSSYTPYNKVKIELEFEFLPVGTLNTILEIFRKPILIQPDPSSFAPTTNSSDYDWKNRYYHCNWMDDQIDFKYTSSYKGSGYSGKITLIEA